jgi:hypothetical protein
MTNHIKLKYLRVRRLLPLAHGSPDFVLA